MAFDPDAPASPGSGIFGFPHSREQAHIVLIPAPFDATVSYGVGAGNGPAAIFEASRQVDLFDTQFGAIYESGIFMASIDDTIVRASKAARKQVDLLTKRGGDAGGDALKSIEVACASVNDFVQTSVARCLDDGKIPGVIGGEHSVALGSIVACAEHLGDEAMGVLQVDAHMDLRVAFEGFTYSHASVMHNALERVPNLVRLVQIGLRDVGKSETEAAAHSDGRILPHFDLDWRFQMDAGRSFLDLCREAIAPLPGHVYISFDIDGLDPSLCPNTGTPTPGGVGFAEACMLLQVVLESGRRVVGFDLCEVSPPDGALDCWDANVGARILYKLCGLAVRSNETKSEAKGSV